MQVYSVIGTGMSQPEFFRNFQDIEHSLKISYSACACVDVVKSPTTGPIKFTITGFRGVDNNEPFKDELLVTRYPVWDSPTHL